MRVKYLWLMVAEKDVEEGQCVDPHVGGAGFIRQGENNTCAEENMMMSYFSQRRRFMDLARDNHRRFFSYSLYNHTKSKGGT